MNEPIIMTNIHLDRIPPILMWGYFCTRICSLKENSITETQGMMYLASEDGQTGSSDSDRGHSIMLFLRSKRDSCVKSVN